MAKNTATTVPATSAPMTVAMPQSLGVLAAWPAIYYLFHGRFESVDISAEGVTINGLTMSTDHGVDAETVVSDVNRRDRRTQLFPTALWLDGSAPAPFANPNEITQIGVAYFNGDKETGSTKQREYFKAAAGAYKAANGGLGRKRGPKTTRLNLKDLTNVDPSVLESAGTEGAARLIAIAQAFIDSQNVSAAEEVTA